MKIKRFNDMVNESSMFDMSSNDLLIKIIIKSYKSLIIFEPTHHRYVKAIKHLNGAKDTCNERIETSYRSEEDNIGKIANDAISDILREENLINFSVGMYKALICTIDNILENKELEIISDEEYVLYDEEMVYLKKEFNL